MTHQETGHLWRVERDERERWVLRFGERESNEAILSRRDGVTVVTTAPGEEIPAHALASLLVRAEPDASVRREACCSGPYHSLGTVVANTQVNMRFEQRGEEYMFIAPRDTGIVLSCLTWPATQEPYDGWLAVIVGCMVAVELPVAGCAQGFPLRIPVPPRQSFSVKSRHVAAPFELALRWDGAT